MRAKPLTDGWQRLRPIAMVVYLMRFLRVLLNNALPGLLPVFALMASMERGRFWVLVGLGILLAVFAIAFSILSFLRFAYRVDADRLLVRRGVFARENLAIDFSRIQTVSINIPFYTRWAGAVIVGVDTAGSAGKETTLPGITEEFAEAFRAQVVAYGDEHPAAMNAEDETEQSADASEAEKHGDSGAVLVAVGRKDLVRYGLSQLNMVWVAIAVGFVSQYIDWDDFSDFVEDNFSWVLNALQGALKLGLVADIFIALGLILLAMAFLGLFSVIRALFTYDGFTLRQEGDRFVSRAGLVNSRQQSLQLRRVQAVEIHQNALSRLFGRVKLVVRLTSAGSNEAQQLQGMLGVPQFVVPAITLQQAMALCQILQPGLEPQDMRYTKPHLLFVVRIWLYFVLPPMATATLATMAVGLWPISMLALLVGVCIIPVLLQRRKRYGLAVDRRHVGVRSGFVGTSFVYFEQAKCQRIDLVQSRGQRRKEMASISFHLTSHTFGVPWLPMSLVNPMRNLLLYQAAINPRAGLEHLRVS